MLNPFQVFPIVVGQAFVRQSLDRTPEQFDESAVMDDLESVNQYDEALQSKLSIVYAGALERIHRIRRRTTGGRALDLCCGPGHFTLLVAKYFDYDEVIGVDLSQPMVDAANRNAKEWGLAHRVKFEVGDATAYPANDQSFDIVTCNDAAHHMPNLDVVKSLLIEMERLSVDDGMVLLTDLVRLKSASLTDRYTSLIGQDYIERGLDSFQRDFCNSMDAAWTGSELKQAIPTDRSRRWHHVTQRLLPTVQFVTGYPNDADTMLMRDGLPWAKENHPVPKELRADWSLFRRLI